MFIIMNKLYSKKKDLSDTCIKETVYHFAERFTSCIYVYIFIFTDILHPRFKMSEDDSKKFTWGAVAAVQPVSFADLMSEELADHLNQQELRQGVLNKVLSA